MQKTWNNKSSSENEEHQTFIEVQNHCPLCGTEVNIEVSKETGLEISTYQLDEQAFCPSCNIQTRQKSHSIH